MSEAGLTPAFPATGGQILPGLKPIAPYDSIAFPFHCTQAIFRLEVQGALRTVTLKVPADWDLKDLKVGDQVSARYIQELAVGVSEAPAASFNPPTTGQQ